MPNLVEVNYAQTGQSTKISKMGMREMQERAYQARDAQYLLLKAPQASGKSRALSFIALDKLYDPKKMPAGLKQSHQHLDTAAEQCCRSKPFVSDEERLEYLFKLYGEMVGGNKFV